MKSIQYAEAFEKLWSEESERKSQLTNRLYCIVFLFCNPISSVAFYLSGDPFFYTLFTTHLFSGLFLLLYLFLNYKKVITGHQMSFAAHVTLIFFYSYLLSLPHLSYVQSSLNLTLAIIFAGMILRWEFRYALVASVLPLVLYPLSIHFASDTSLTLFFEQGGVFVLVANCIFPVIVKLRYNKDKAEFYFRYTLQQQNEALAQQKHIAENATRAKSNFLSLMSHEIRTPLNGIVGIVHLMMQEENRSEPRSGELLHTLKYSADHMMTVVNDVLDFNKINSRHVVLDPQPFDPRQLFENLRKMFGPGAIEKGIELIFEIEPNLPDLLIADRMRLKQILKNLIHNGVKFTAEGFVRLKVEQKEITSDFVKLYFEVTDTGIGIHESEQREIFEVFTQTKASNQRENAGTGLGLAISRDLLQLFNSEIVLRSEPGKGSTFSFELTLRYSQSTETDYPATTLPTPPREGIKVLVVDDNRANIVLVTQLLKRRNLDFEIAVNGQEAYEMFAREKFDMVLMDLRMPVMDGFESTRMIRLLDKQVPVVALTASSFEDEKERAMSTGFSGYLTKPFIPEDFYNYILPFLGIAATDASE
ncbi:response regulator [Dyadobacter sp. CY343]|uniref:response regulator n=1 Tax=Dyadobacter sp. CY343 TaxID=2907299 RepID=UPI001F290DB7|nr:response regulator [Dyadobacter sp. CY343]MCE7060980.1 response regulator [Dyadobacter sp. CY343]